MMDLGFILMAGRRFSLKWGWEAPWTPKMTSPFALQSIFSGGSIAEHPPLGIIIFCPEADRVKVQRNFKTSQRWVERKENGNDSL